ncbi:FK506-binding protein-like [Hyla sarda]|uniref:FK506-binding protein-like n=1 Tax=Hyla sarda TaxID=327740 RepID=UPI0024C38A9B|nr:FK506-binding protein-like [Hyla sarda]XP_056395012.1 FK506-binding protein-like [Hyla sarda]XP_056395014.1 FK506-binding protein-like [Hyla sarda]
MDSPPASPDCRSWYCPDGSFTKTILEPGSGVDKPKEYAMCTIFLEPLSNPTTSTIDNGYPAGSWVQIELGEGDTSRDRLIDQCLETMLPGEVCRVDSALGFQFILRLESFRDGKEAWELDVNEKMERAARDREAGGKAYRDGNLEGAERRYARALRLLVCTPGDAEEDKIALLSNLAACDLKKGRLREAEVRCTRVLDKNPDHLKALYRRGMARAGMSDWMGAREDLEKVLKLDPGNKEARREIGKVREKQKNEQAQISKALGKMFL